MKKKIITIFVALFTFLLIVNFRWIIYLGHLAKHQAKVILFKERIVDRLKKNNLDPKERNALTNTLKLRAALEQLYEIKNSKSYTAYYALGRDALGYNITVASALSLKPESFHFWPIGSFAYLGFFDKEYAETWAKKYHDKGYDVHLAEIGGYSTLGWFEDPLYSSQLKWGTFNLAHLLAHEIAHEKLYIKNNTELSEMIASFIEKKAAPDAMRVAQLWHGEDKKASLFKKRRNELVTKLLSLREKLQQLYASSLNDIQKLNRKKEWITILKKEIEQKRDYYFVKGSIEINNASLAQIKRYTPNSPMFEKIFDACLEKDKAHVYSCWFSAVEKQNKK
ncbi:MAG TPA: aminopeptidase [Turneriella sp.]|nr:aminopeptidase [Turneriella sp.]